MAIERKGFIGGLNSDTEDRFMPQGDYRYALNIRGSKSDGANEGAIENVKGNTLVSFSFTSNGTHKCVGAYDDSLNNKVYYFVWNSNNEHEILEYSADNNTVYSVIKTSYLNLIEDSLIVEQNISIIDGKMYWTNIKPYKINIEEAKDLTSYYYPLREEYLEAIVKPPTSPPDTSFGSTDIVNETDPIKTNNVRNKLFQFRYKFIYKDNEESAWSPISKVSLPVNEAQFRPYTYYDSILNNYINVDVETGSPLVSRIKVSFREGNLGDFYLTKDFDKSKLSIDDDLNYSFRFYNNEINFPIDNDGATGMRLYDWVPLEANSQSLIDGNIIAYGGVVDGYDPVNTDTEVEVIYNSLDKNQLAPITTTQPINNQTTPYGWNFQVTGYQAFSNVFIEAWNDTTPLIDSDRLVLKVANSTAYTDWWIYWRKGVTTNFFGTQNNVVNFGLAKNSRGAWGTDSSDKWAQTVIQNEVIIAPQIPNTSLGAGSKIVLTVKYSWFSYETNTIKNGTKTFQATYLTTDTDTTFYQKLINGIYVTNITENVKTTMIARYNNASISGSTIPASGTSISLTLTSQYIGTTYSGGFSFPSPRHWAELGIGNPPAALSLSHTITSYSSWTANVEKTLKMGAKHGIGLVYYDKFNRSTLVNELDSFYVKFPTERIQTTSTPPVGVMPFGNITDVVELELKINHLAPEWATHYQVVYTGNQTIEKIDTTEGYKGFLQIRLANVSKHPTIQGAAQGYFSYLNNPTTGYNNITPEILGLNYGFSPGDRIRFLKTKTDFYLSGYFDVEVISFDKSTGVIVFKNPGFITTTNREYIVEIYSPKKSSSFKRYFEIGERYEVTEEGFHQGSDVDQFIVGLSGPNAPINLNASPFALIRLRDIGDVYLKYRDAPIKTQVEDYNYSDYYDSDVWDKGRPNIVDDNIKQTYRPTTIRYSEAYIPETNINGLSAFNDFSFNSYDQKYGDIMLMYSEDKALNIFQKLKVGKIGINQNTMFGNDGEVIGTLRNESKVLTDIRYYSGEFGIGLNPESFAVRGNNKYFTDAKRGAVLRLGRDGITPISEFKMHNYFNDIFNDLDTNTLPYKIIGTYDVRFDEYILSINNGEIFDTVVFSEAKNRWVSYSSIVPEYMISNRTGLITFRDGQLYTHNTNSIYNNFYGNQYTTKLRFISNAEPGYIKFYNSIRVKASHVFSMPEATNQFGQSTSLITSDFVDDEGVWKAALLKDANTPNVALPLIEGDDIRCHSLDITLENDDTELVKIIEAEISLELSEMTKK